MNNPRIIVLALATVLAILLVLALPLHFQKFQLEHFRSIESGGAESIWFADVNGDGFDDLISCSRYSYTFLPDASCTCFSLDEQLQPYVIDQINVPALLDGPTLAAASNYNHDAFDEVLIPTVEDGHLWLRVYEGPDLTTPIRKVYLDTLYTRDDKAHVSFHMQGQWDADGDGYDEVWVGLFNGFPIHPRRNYLVDVHRGTAIASPATSGGMCIAPMAHQKAERAFTGYSVIPGNDHGEGWLPYSDMFGYAFAFDDQLQFLFEPAAVTAFPGRAESLVKGNRLYTYILHNDDNRRVEFQKRSLPQGELLHTATLESIEGLLMPHGDEMVVFGNGKALVIDTNLQVVRRIEDPRMARTRVAADLNGDGQLEYIHTNAMRNELTVYHRSFRHPTSAKFPYTPSQWHLSPATRSGQTLLAGLDEGEIYFYTYAENPYFWLKWPTYLAICALAWAISGLMFQWYRKHIETRYAQEQELGRLHLLAFKNQMDPHFTLNALNSIDQMYRNNEPERASHFTEQLSRLVYTTLRDSDKPLTPLQQELDFCRNYCTLETYRDPDFTFAIEVDEAIDLFEVHLPRQFVFIHVENAIKHGLRPLERPKKLWIKVGKAAGAVHIEVSNNGIPYDPDGKKQDGSTGLGFHLLEKMKAIYARLEGRKIGYRIHAGHEVGTHVEIWLENPSIRGQAGH